MEEDMENAQRTEDTRTLTPGAIETYAMVTSVTVQFILNTQNHPESVAT